jgi:hypothetical protein
MAANPLQFMNLSLVDEASSLRAVLKYQMSFIESRIWNSSLKSIPYFHKRWIGIPIWCRLVPVPIGLIAERAFP